ncbi:MAG TPA: hypothetical protein VFZ61_31510, partial [Polyangiales bacterium]
MGPVLFWVAASMLVFAPLFRGGNRPLPLLVLECLALAGLMALALSAPLRETWRLAPPALRWAIAILVAYPLVQLVPLPYAWWAALPGHEPYARALESVGGSGARALSIHARATEYAWLALLPCVAIFLMVQRLGRRQV